MDGEGIYFHFPICLLRNINLQERLPLPSMIYYGVYWYAVNVIGGDDLERAIMEAGTDFYELSNFSIQDAKIAIETACMVEGSGQRTDVITSLNKRVISDFFKIEKSKRQKEQLLLSLALRSIIGKKKMATASKDLIEARVNGFATVEEYKNANLTQPIKYTHPRLTRMLDLMELNWRFIFYKARGNRTYPFTIRGRMSLELLVNIIEDRKEVNRVKRKQEEKRKRIEEIKRKRSP